MSKKCRKDPKEIVHVPLEQIDRKQQSWHVRISARDEDVRKLANLIERTGDVEPITLGPAAEPGGPPRIGLGRMRFLAAEFLAMKTIPAYVLAEVDAVWLMDRAMADDEGRTRYSPLERGWALLRLEKALVAEGVHFQQKDLGRRPGWDEGTISGAMKAGRAITEQRLRDLSSQGGLDWDSLVTIPRDALRHIANAPEEDRNELLRAGAEAVQKGRNAEIAVKRKRVSLSAPLMNEAGSRCWGIGLIRRLLATLLRVTRFVVGKIRWRLRQASGSDTSKLVDAEPVAVDPRPIGDGRSKAHSGTRRERRKSAGRKHFMERLRKLIRRGAVGIG
jgi:ParB-like chromosome segregation protein Spo0J